MKILLVISGLFIFRALIVKKSSKKIFSLMIGLFLGSIALLLFGLGI